MRNDPRSTWKTMVAETPDAFLARPKTVETFRVRVAPTVLDAHPAPLNATLAAAGFLRDTVYATLDATVEHFAVVAVNAKNKVTGFKVIGTGHQSATLVHPREVFTAAFLLNANGLLVAHNHPSGDPRPSAEDDALTRRLVTAAEVLGFRILDHVVLGSGTAYYSYCEAGFDLSRP